MIKKVILNGRVQGVGCRYYCAKYARKYLINGSASNMNDGSVRLFLKVDNETVFKSFINSLISNSDGYVFYGIIDDVSVSDYSGKTDGDYNF